ARRRSRGGPRPAASVGGGGARPREGAWGGRVARGRPSKRYAAGLTPVTLTIFIPAFSLIVPETSTFLPAMSLALSNALLSAWSATRSTMSPSPVSSPIGWPLFRHFLAQSACAAPLAP